MLNGCVMVIMGCTNECVLYASKGNIFEIFFSPISVPMPTMYRLDSAVTLCLYTYVLVQVQFNGRPESLALGEHRL